VGQTTVIYAKFLHDVACQKLLKSADVSQSHSKNNTDTVFLRQNWLQFVFVEKPPLQNSTRDLALASIVRDDPPASSTASSTVAESSTESSTAAVLLAARPPQCAVKWDRNLKPKLAVMRQCTSVTDRQTDTDIVA